MLTPLRVMIEISHPCYPLRYPPSRTFEKTASQPHQLRKPSLPTRRYNAHIQLLCETTPQVGHRPSRHRESLLPMSVQENDSRIRTAYGPQDHRRDPISIGYVSQNRLEFRVRYLQPAMLDALRRACLILVSEVRPSYLLHKFHRIYTDSLLHSRAQVVSLESSCFNSAYQANYLPRVSAGESHQASCALRRALTRTLMHQNPSLLCVERGNQSDRIERATKLISPSK